TSRNRERDEVHGAGDLEFERIVAREDLAGVAMLFATTGEVALGRDRDRTLLGMQLKSGVKRASTPSKVGCQSTSTFFLDASTKRPTIPGMVGTGWAHEMVNGAPSSAPQGAASPSRVPPC